MARNLIEERAEEEREQGRQEVYQPGVLLPTFKMVPLKEAALVNPYPSAVKSEVGDVAHQRHLLDLERERLQFAVRSRTHGIAA